MNIVLNGEALEVEAGSSLAQLVEAQGLTGKRIAVEVNAQLVTRSEHVGYQLQEADRVEIVQAIGGG
ncbi:MAG: sulfur carrier protein ThiS [Gammaproteobacteria bacterium SHHR-1]|uniref:sulfur carrier protein ThiS n=1 Tax=Magnetovirga frankeli TaxID=947516 RepID=UPI001292D929|nr:sulfur carrier protein ThiS [gamma proteobacterium SS-5]